MNPIRIKRHSVKQIRTHRVPFTNENFYTHLMSFDDVFQFSEQFCLDVRAQVDDRSRQAVVLT